MSDYIKFTAAGVSESGKTDIVDVMSVNDFKIGTIKWYSNWRRYCYYPLGNTIYDVGCLAAISNKINEMMGLRK